MRNIEKINAFYLIAVLICVSLFFNGCGGGGGGGSVSSQAVPGGGGSEAGPMIKIEAEIDMASLGLDSTASVDLSKFVAVVVDNAAYKKAMDEFRTSAYVANRAPSRMGGLGPIIAASVGAVVAITAASSGIVNVNCSVPAPLEATYTTQSTLIFTDRLSGTPLLATPLGTLPGSSLFYPGNNTGGSSGGVNPPANNTVSSKTISISVINPGTVHVYGFDQGAISTGSSGYTITSYTDGSRMTFGGCYMPPVTFNGNLGVYITRDACAAMTITFDSLGPLSTVMNNSSNLLIINNITGADKPNLTFSGSGPVNITSLASDSTITNNGTGLVTVMKTTGNINKGGTNPGNIKINDKVSDTQTGTNNSFSGTITVNGLPMNAITTAQSFINIENNLNSDISLIDVASVKSLINSSGASGGVINISSSDPKYCNSNMIGSVINNACSGVININEFANSIDAVNKMLLSDSVPKSVKDLIIANMNTGNSMITSMINGFISGINNDTILKSLPGITTSVNIGGTVIDSRTTPSLVNSLQSNFTSIVPDARIPSLSNVKAYPASVVAGEKVNIMFKADMELAAPPKVYIFGRAAEIFKISSAEYASRVEVLSTDSIFDFTIDSIIGINGKISSAPVKATTDGSTVTVIKNNEAVLTPVATPPAGNYESPVSVELSTKTPGAFIIYTTNGNEPSAFAGNFYSGPIAVTQITTIKAVAVFNGAASSVMTGAYKVSAPLVTAAAPNFSVPGGAYNREQAVEITCATSGAKIRYTLDGSLPSKTTGTLYSAPVKIVKNAFLKAIAFGDGMNDSKVSSAVYDISEQVLSAVAVPAITPPSGVYRTQQAVSISCPTAGASIRYTLDGSAPSFSRGEIFSASFIVSKTATVRAMAFKAGMADSDIASASIEITGETEVKPPVTGIAEMEPKRNQTQVNSDFDIMIAAPSGARITAAVGSASVLNGIQQAVAAGDTAVLPIGVSKLVEGATSEIKIKAVSISGETIGEMSVFVKKDTAAPRREKMSAASSNAGGASIAELGDRIVISFSTDEPVKNVIATMMNKPVTVRNTDGRNWTVARYLDGTEDAVEFDFMISFTDLAGNPLAYPLTKKDINEGAPLVIKSGAGNSAFNIFRKDGVNKLYLSAVPAEMEYSLDGVSAKTPGTWFAGKGSDVDLNGAAGSKFIFVRQKGVALSAQCLGKILSAPQYGIDGLNSNNRWAFDASTGAVILTSLNDGVSDLDESRFSIHIYSGAGPADGVPVMDYYMNPIAPGSAGKVSVPSFIKSSWNAGEYVSFYLKTNNGTPYITEDDIYVQPAAGVAVKPAPVNSAETAAGNFVYDGRSNTLVFANTGGVMAEVSVLAALNAEEAVKLTRTSQSAYAAVSFKLPYQPQAGNELSVSVEYKDRTVSGTAKLTVSGAPRNLADGFGNFSVKALLGQIAVTNFDSARDGYTAFVSTDNGLNWKELGRISSNVGQNFNVTLTASSKVKLAMRDTKGNFSPTQAEGVSPMAAPANADSGDRAFLVLGHVKKLEVNNSTGAMNGFNILYSFDGGVNWSSTATVSGTGKQRLDLPQYILSGSKIKVALLEWNTGNASYASADYTLKAAGNRVLNAVDGDYTVKANEKKVYINNAAASLNGFGVFVNGSPAGLIASAASSFTYQPDASNEVSLYYADTKGNTWLSSKSKPVAIPVNNKFADGDFFVNVPEGKITFKNSEGKMTGLTPLVSLDGGVSWKEPGPALTAGDKQFALEVKAGDAVAAAFKDADGNVGAASDPYTASGPKINTPVKMLLAGDGGAGAKAGLIVESGKAAVKLRPGVALKNGESIKVTLSNGGGVSMTAKASVDGVIPVFGESTPGVIYEAGAAGNGSPATGSFNLSNTGGTPVSILGTIEVAASYSDVRGNISPVSKMYITADQTPPLWTSGYPSISAPAYFSLKVNLRTNEDGRIYLACLKSTEPPPTAAQIKLGLNASGAPVEAGLKTTLDFTADSGVLSHTFTKLDNNTEYAVHAAAEDQYENLQVQPAIIKLKTLNNIAPIWATGYPRAEAPEFFKLKAGLMMNETGSVYLVCRKAGLPALTAAQVKAGTDALGSAVDSAMKAVITMGVPDSEAVHIFSGLDNAAEYDIYAVADDEYGQLQTNPTVMKIRTIDNTPPVWASGYPQGQPTGYTSLRISLNADKKSFVYAVCLTSGAAAPSTAQIIAGKNASDIELASNLRGTVEVAANTAGYINFSNLAVGGAYDIYAVAESEYKIAQTAAAKTRVNTIAFTPPSFQVQYYSDAGMLTEIADTPVLKAGTYYLKITANVALNAPPKVFITTEAAVNDISDVAATHVESNRIYKLTRTIGSDAAAVGSVQENIEISATSVEGVSVTKLKPSNLSTKGAFIDTVAPAGTVAYSKSGGFYENTDFTPARQYVKNGDNFTATFTYTEGIKAGVTPKFKIAKPDTTQVIYADMTPNGDRTVWTYNVASLAATAGEEFLPTVTIEGAVDKAGNPASYTFTKPLYIDNKGPVFTPVTIASNNANPVWAKTGDAVTLSFTAGEKLNAAPVVKFKANGANERTATIGGPTGLAYTGVYTMQAADSDGAITFTLNGADMVGNAATQVTAVTSGSGVTFDKTISAPTLTSPAQNSPVFADFAITVATEASATVTAKIGATNVLKTGTSATANGAGSATFTVNIAALTAGAVNAIDIVATDPAGNVSSGLTANMDKGYVLSGTITDSTSQVVPNVTVSVKNGATVLNSTTSASNGTYSLIAGRTTYDMEYARNGYVTTTDSINMSGGNQTNSPTLTFAPGTFRIVMEWTAVVDLDSYTRVPAGGSAVLDFDNTAGGPGAKETTTVLSTSADGNYHFSVLKYSAGSGTVRGRGATVKVFDNTGQIGATMSCPAPLGGDLATDSWWDAVTVNKAGTTITITNVYNTTTTSQPLH
jgi:hypothetical protein